MTPDATVGLREFFRVIGRRIWWALIPPVLVAGALAYVLYTAVPVYRSTTTLIVTNGSGDKLDYDTLLFNRNLAKTYLEVARSASVAGGAIRKLDLPMMVTELQDRMSVTTVRDTEVIAISVTDTDPRRAAAVANTVALIFGEQYKEYTNLDNLRLLDPAVPPRVPIQPRPMLYGAIAGAAGLVGAIALAFLVEALAPRRRTEPEPPTEGAMPGA